MVVARAPKSDYKPAPQGLFQAVCCDVEDLGQVENKAYHKLEHKVRIWWMLEELREDGQPYLVGQMYTNSLHEKAKLRAHLESWRGRAFTPVELDGFDLDAKLIGANCQLQVVHNISKDGRTFANVSAIVKLGKGMVNLTVPPTYVRRKDRQPEAGAPTNGEGPDDGYDDSVPFSVALPFLVCLAGLGGLIA